MVGNGAWCWYLQGHPRREHTPRRDRAEGGLRVHYRGGSDRGGVSRGGVRGGRRSQRDAVWGAGGANGVQRPEIWPDYRHERHRTVAHLRDHRPGQFRPRGTGDFWSSDRLVLQQLLGRAEPDRGRRRDHDRLRDVGRGVGNGALPPAEAPSAGHLPVGGGHHRPVAARAPGNPAVLRRRAASLYRLPSAGAVGIRALGGDPSGAGDGGGDHRRLAGYGGDASVDPLRQGHPSGVGQRQPGRGIGHQREPGCADGVGHGSGPGRTRRGVPGPRHRHRSVLGLPAPVVDLRRGGARWTGHGVRSAGRLADNRHVHRG